jgi:hypothetical protein
MWGSSDDPAKRAEEERKKANDLRMKKIQDERKKKAERAKEERKLKKKKDEERAEEIEKKRQAGREEADAATESLSEGDHGNRATPSPQYPRLNRSGFGGMNFSSPLANPTDSAKGGSHRYVPPGSNQPGVSQNKNEPPHRSGGETSPPPPAHNVPKLNRPF